MKHFALSEEPASVRTSYGGEFGQRCLLARRLVQAGVRFIEVSHNLNFINGTGWDVHNEGIDNQHLLIRELDTALAGLIRDLEANKLLDKTLVVIGTEFGRGVLGLLLYLRYAQHVQGRRLAWLTIGLLISFSKILKRQSLFM